MKKLFLGLILMSSVTANAAPAEKCFIQMMDKFNASEAEAKTVCARNLNNVKKITTCAEKTNSLLKDIYKYSKRTGAGVTRSDERKYFRLQGVCGEVAGF